jgi:hypothetical protein
MGGHSSSARRRHLDGDIGACANCEAYIGLYQARRIVCSVTNRANPEALSLQLLDLFGLLPGRTLARILSMPSMPAIRLAGPALSPVIMGDILYLPGAASRAFASHAMALE